MSKFINKIVKRKLKDGDILVLAKERNVIYEYNGKGKSQNAYNVAVHFFSNGNTSISYKLNDQDVVAYNAPWDYATPEEIERFNNALKNNDVQCKQMYACDIAEQIAYHYIYDEHNQYKKDTDDYEKLLTDLSNEIFEIINTHFPTN